MNRKNYRAKGASEKTFNQKEGYLENQHFICDTCKCEHFGVRQIVSVNVVRVSNENAPGTLNSKDNKICARLSYLRFELR